LILRLLYQLCALSALTTLDAQFLTGLRLIFLVDVFGNLTPSASSVHLVGANYSGRAVHLLLGSLSALLASSVSRSLLNLMCALSARATLAAQFLYCPALN
jgi:hypothetical protein